MKSKCQPDHNGAAASIVRPGGREHEAQRHPEEQEINMSNDPEARARGIAADRKKDDTGRMVTLERTHQVS